MLFSLQCLLAQSKCLFSISVKLFFDVIIFGPKKLSFPTYKFLCNVATFVNIETNFCGEEFPFVIQNRTMAGQFSAHIWTSIIGGFIISFPYVIYELWKFISPGMHENERKKSNCKVLSNSFQKRWHLDLVWMVLW